MNCQVIGVVQELDLRTQHMTHKLKLYIPQADAEILLETEEATVQRIIQAAVGAGPVSYDASDEMDDSGESYAQTFGDNGQTTPDETVLQQLAENNGLFEQTIETGADIFGGDFDSKAADDDVDGGEVSPQPPAPPPPIPQPPEIPATRKISDRSGVPARTLPGHLVDAKGNPIVRGGAQAEIFYDEDESYGDPI